MIQHFFSDCLLLRVNCVLPAGLAAGRFFRAGSSPSGNGPFRLFQEPRNFPASWPLLSGHLASLWSSSFFARRTYILLLYDLVYVRTYTYLELVHSSNFAADGMPNAEWWKNHSFFVQTPKSASEMDHSLAFIPNLPIKLTWKMQWFIYSNG